MNKTALSLSLLLMGALGATAEVLTPARALQRLETSEAVADAPRRMAARAARAAVPARTVEAQGLPAIYLFTPADGGLLALTAESDAEALVGYTDNYMPGNQLPPALEYMLEHYAAEIADLRDGKVAMPAEAASRADDRASIAPICTTRWNQSSPYNDLCPKLNGEPTMTGCVATAMAQVLKAYEYPARCSGGSYSYLWQAGQKNLTLNFDDVTLDWASMADTYAEDASAPAVATLMQALGYAADMAYSPTASGAQSQTMAVGLVRNFDYDCTLNHEQRSWYPLAQWQTMIYDVLATGKPVYYDGTTPNYTSAHAFVVDGYSSNGFFHLNWGWGGMSDGYFRLSALDPGVQGIGGSSAGYDALQGAIIGLKAGATTPRASAPLHYFTPSPFAAVGSSAKLGADVTFEGGLYNNGPLLTSRFAPAIKIVASDGATRYVASMAEYSNVPVNSGVETWTVNIPRNLTDGVYTIFPAVKNVGSVKYYDSKTDIGGDGYIIAEVENGNVYFENRSAGKLTCSSVNIPEVVYPNTPFYLSATLSNESEDVYSGSVWVNVFPEGGRLNQLLGNIGAFVVELEPGESTTVNLPFSFPADLALGKYDLALFDDDDRRLTSSRTVTLATRPPVGTLTCSKITVPVKAQNKLTFSVDVACSGGLYADAVYVVLTPSNSNTILDYFTSAPVIVEDGGKATVTLTGNFSAGKPGSRYKAYAYYFDGSSNVPMEPVQPVSFRLAEPDFSAIESVEADGAEPEYFDLSGRRVARPANGIFIRRQGSVISKVRL